MKSVIIKEIKYGNGRIEYNVLYLDKGQFEEPLFWAVHIIFCGILIPAYLFKIIKLSYSYYKCDSLSEAIHIKNLILIGKERVRNKRKLAKIKEYNAKIVKSKTIRT